MIPVMLRGFGAAGGRTLGRIISNTIYGADRHASQLISADIVFVIGTSGSMSDDIQAIRQRIGEFDTAFKGAIFIPATAW